MTKSQEQTTSSYKSKKLTTILGWLNSDRYELLDEGLAETFSVFYDFMAQVKPSLYDPCNFDNLVAAVRAEHLDQVVALHRDMDRGETDPADLDDEMMDIVWQISEYLGDVYEMIRSEGDKPYEGTQELLEFDELMAKKRAADQATSLEIL